MIYFNGFSLQNEEGLFTDYIHKSESYVSGFSYGAQKALDYVYQSTERIDRLILLSPAFFQTKKHSFLRTQLRYFEAGKEEYVKQFLLNVSYPSKLELMQYLKVGTREDLEGLLTYVWDEEKIKEILKRGTTIEVFLGENDKIINSKEALNFFTPLTTTYFIKNAGHALHK